MESLNLFKKWGWFVVIILLLGSGTILICLNLVFPSVLSDDEKGVRLTYLLLLLLIVASTLFLKQQFQLFKMLRHFFIWISFGFLLFTAYTFRHDARYVVSRLFGELIPSHGTETEQGLSFPVSKGGHFFVVGKIRKTPVRFLVDTGASEVVLAPKDAKRIGYNIKSLDFSKSFSTANGRVFAAPITLDRITVGNIALENVSASINKTDMRHSLLGMTFLKRLSSYEFIEGKLILRPD